MNADRVAGSRARRWRSRTIGVLTVWVLVAGAGAGESVDVPPGGTIDLDIVVERR